MKNETPEATANDKIIKMRQLKAAGYWVSLKRRYLTL
jgi:hypothetical protein